jgi:histidyl-tRNA synthetase
MIFASMTKKYQAFPGMEDILPGEVEKWQWVEEKARIFFESRGFREIRTPLLEPTELFTRSIGEASDIVHKEMYTFEDRGGRSMTLRPEMTASVARAVIENGLLKTAKSLRLYYLGPMFRAERPQAGRKRQFHQIGIEMVNEAAPAADLEAVRLLYQFLIYAGLQKPLLRVNDLGEKKHRGKLVQALTEYFSHEKSKLCEDCRWRLTKNVLRIFDCKVESCQPVIQKAPWEEIAPFSGSFETVTSQLRLSGIPFEIQRRLVRGLDYYNGTVFEAAAQGLGAQDAVAGGGRYDDLYLEFGGSQTPCTGFSLGVERLLSALEKQEKPLLGEIDRHKVYLAPLDSNSELLDRGYGIALELRKRGIHVETTPGETSLSSHLKKANQKSVRFVLILGPDEIKKGKCAVKDLEEKKQTEIEMDKMAGYMQEVMGL